MRRHIIWEGELSPVVLSLCGLPSCSVCPEMSTVTVSAAVPVSGPGHLVLARSAAPGPFPGGQRDIPKSVTHLRLLLPSGMAWRCRTLHRQLSGAGCSSWLWSRPSTPAWWTWSRRWKTPCGESGEAFNASFTIPFTSPGLPADWGSCGHSLLFLHSLCDIAPSVTWGRIHQETSNEVIFISPIFLPIHFHNFPSVFHISQYNFLT